MMLKPRTLVSMPVLLLSTTALAQTVAAPFTSATRYDIAGRVTGTISASASGTQGPFLATRNSYDGSGNLSTVETGQLASWQDESIAPANWASFTPDRATSYSYDSYGRKTREQLYAGAIAAGQIAAVTQYGYDLYGRVVCTAVRMDPSQWGGQPDACVPQTTGPNGADRITKTSYDYLGDVTTIQRAVGTSLQQNYATYTWDTSTGGAGKPATVADANGNLTSYTYGGTALNLLTQSNFPSPTTAGQSSSTDYEAYLYDANGNRTSLRKRDGGTITYAYDALNRVTQKNVPASASGAAGYSVFYGYDLGGRQLYARFGSAGGAGITNSYDGFGQLASQTNNMGGASRTIAHSYDADGNRAAVTHPDGHYFPDGYDGLDRMTSVGEDGGVTLATFSYDGAGRHAGTAYAGASSSYGYDGVGRLSSLGHDLVGTSADQVLTFGYNPASQIVTRTASNAALASNTAYNVSRAYSVNGLNQYTAVGTASFAYDANGNLTSDSTNSYVYDAENRLVSGSGGVALAYDPNGRLWQVSGGSAGTTQFLYDGDELIGEYNGGGAMMQRYVHGNGVDDPLIWYDYTTGGYRRGLFADHEGSIIAASAANGSPVGTNAYDPWGIPNSTSTARVGRFGYTGQAWLPELGMYYYKARIYSPTLGRFLQTDPVGYKEQINLYAYVANDPVDARDPTGERIHLNGGVQVEAALKAAILAAGRSSPAMMQKLKDMIASPHSVEVYAIPHGTEPYSTPIPPPPLTNGYRDGRGSDAQVGIDLGGSTEADGKLADPGAQAGHELFGHGWDTLNGVLDFRTDPRTGVPISEERAVRTENEYRRSAHQEIRNDYRGRDVTASGATRPLPPPTPCNSGRRDASCNQ